LIGIQYRKMTPKLHCFMIRAVTRRSIDIQPTREKEEGNQQ